MFNSPGTRRRATECRCTTTCQKGNGKHHSSISDKLSNQVMLATGGGQVMYPSRVVEVQVTGIRCGALLDSRDGSSYLSAPLTSELNREPDRREYKRIEMMMTSTTQKIQMYKVKLSNITGVFRLATTLRKVYKATLLTIPNPECM